MCTAETPLNNKLASTMIFAYFVRNLRQFFPVKKIPVVTISFLLLKGDKDANTTKSPLLIITISNSLEGVRIGSLETCFPPFLIKNMRIEYTGKMGFPGKSTFGFHGIGAYMISKRFPEKTFDVKNPESRVRKKYHGIVRWTREDWQDDLTWYRTVIIAQILKKIERDF